jgi:pimeloyl-ACP methyl ester carboxylesterase
LCTRDLWRGQIDALAGDADIIVADIGRAHDFPTMARQILAQAPERFSLAGLSMGGYIAFEVLRQAPDRVSRLALLDTNARADRPEQIKQRHLLIGMGRALGVRAVQAALLKFLLHPSRLDDRVLVDRVLAMADSTGQPAFERQQTAIMGRPDNRSFLAGITCPTLIVVGEQDALTPVKVAQEMQAGIAGSRLEVIADCGHLPTMERPEVASKLLADWLRR